jgi:hypothetical protein
MDLKKTLKVIASTISALVLVLLLLTSNGCKENTTDSATGTPGTVSTPAEQTANHNGMSAGDMGHMSHPQGGMSGSSGGMADDRMTGHGMGAAHPVHPVRELLTKVRQARPILAVECSIAE